MTHRDEVFCLGAEQFYCRVSGRIFGTWADIGAAKAGLATEQRRAKRRAELMEIARANSRKAQDEIIIQQWQEERRKAS